MDHWNIMIILLGFSIMTIGNSSTKLGYFQSGQCTCEKITEQGACHPNFCNWNSNTSQCTKKVCSEIKQQYCLISPDKFKCIWNFFENRCESFTKCSDYLYPIEYGSLCYTLVKCQADVNSIDDTNEKIRCMDKEFHAQYAISNCEKVPLIHCNWLVTPDGKQCIKNSLMNTCDAKVVNHCSDFNTSELCNPFACFWQDSCKPKTCSSLQENECTYYESLDSKQFTYCIWNGTGCVDLEISQLTMEQCWPKTFSSYYWNSESKKCEYCERDEVNSKSNILLFGALFLVATLN
ncbi:unnamed protein product [Paramecium sonneborni]|uniref:Uncharacterized protein n=1 Tax=Paramecium sonneborni TaxID=65129 RepID=A0A8S1QSA7_9CILI|nr:unnamed protein product [Paramecium sonneborni]